MATIMIVDDDPASRQLVLSVLAHSGHQLREAANGADALAGVQLEPPNLVIADLMMPTVDGFEFVRQLRRIPALALTPVVFLTAVYLESEARALASACGVTQIITKPFQVQQIRDAVSATLGGAPLAVAPLPPEEFHRKHRDLLLAKLAQKIESAPRLDAMIELGLQLASERDPERLLNDFCSVARKIMDAQYAVIGMPEKGNANGKLFCQFASGMTRETIASLNSPPSPMTLPPNVLSERRPHRLHGLAGDPESIGLPAAHPPIHSFLCVPLSSPDRVYGWLCVSERIGAPAFNDEDEGVAQIIAAQVGRIYENRSLDAEVKATVARLEAEVAERKRAQEQVAQLNSELEERVRQRTAELERANQELEAFSYSVSHDLRAPLRAIGGFARMLSQQPGPSLSAQGQHQLERIRQNAAKMGQLIDGLLDFSRLSRQPLQKREVWLTPLVHQALEQLVAEQAGRRVEISVSNLGTCQADPTLLQQVYVNLLSNALKYTRFRNPARIEVGWQEDLGQRVYFVKDNGAGFEMEYATRLFGVFQRLHGPDRFEGTGVGLAITQRIIQRHGGQIWAQAAPEKGAAFFFTLQAGDSHG